jgi:iron(III) transport system substrate-binding protein
VVYTSVDEVYAQEVFARFTEGTGIRVRPVFDTEAGKTTGLYRRLLAERSRPRADVFWNAELCRTIELAEAGVAGELSPLVPADIPRRWVDPGGRWVAFSVRARAIVYNTKMVTEASAPKTLRELTEEPWRGKVAMANPLFGTTASHVAALYEVMGEEEAEKFLRALKVNEVRLVEGNSVVRDLVAHGEVAVGLTDTDDIFSGIDNGYPIALILPDQEGMGAFVIPNSVMLVSGGPDRSAAEAFVRFLLSPEVEELLAFGRARQVPVRADVPRPTELASLASLRAMDVDYGKVAQRMPAVARRVEQLLLR